MTQHEYGKGDALLIVDVQNDFCDGGSLPVPDGDAVVPVINRMIAAAESAGIPIIASRDWHPVGHCSFREQGGPWPVHCVQDTPGADFHPKMNLPDDAVRVSKGTVFDQDAYSAFDGTGLKSWLDRNGIRRLWVGGLAQDVCVLASVKDACAAGYETHLVIAATRPVFPDKHDATLDEMREAGAVIEAAA